MLRESLFNLTAMPIYRNALDAFAARQRAVASNLANTETPGYEPVRVTFEERLKRALGDPQQRLGKSNPGHMPFKGDAKTVRHLVVKDLPAATGNGVNEVDVEREMARLATVQMQFELTAKRAKGTFDRIRGLTKLP